MATAIKIINCIDNIIYNKPIVICIFYSLYTVLNNYK